MIIKSSNVIHTYDIWWMSQLINIILGTDIPI